jgi:AcrR family transcriptional regulator
MAIDPTTTRPPAARRGRPPSGGREAILASALTLLRELGASRLTTREVARGAGVSEGSVFYHFTDRVGLMTAVIEDGLSTVLAMEEGRLQGADIASVLDHFAAAVETFLDRSLVVVGGAQSDVDLRTALAGYLARNDMGPHRGVRVLAAYLRDRQADGGVRPDVDVEAVAFYVYSACFERVAQRQMLSGAAQPTMPDRQALIATMTALLSPPGAGGAPS